MFDDLNSRQLAIELLLADYREFFDRQKVKGRVDHLTGTDTSLGTWEQELQQQAQNISDYGMAQSIANATASGQFLLMQAIDDEIIANSDC